MVSSQGKINVLEKNVAEIADYLREMNIKAIKSALKDMANKLDSINKYGSLLLKVEQLGNTIQYVADPIKKTGVIYDIQAELKSLTDTTSGPIFGKDGLKESITELKTQMKGITDPNTGLSAQIKAVTSQFNTTITWLISIFIAVMGGFCFFIWWRIGKIGKSFPSDKDGPASTGGSTAKTNVLSSPAPYEPPNPSGTPDLF